MIYPKMKTVVILENGKQTETFDYVKKDIVWIMDAQNDIEEIMLTIIVN